MPLTAPKSTTGPGWWRRTHGHRPTGCGSGDTPVRNVSNLPSPPRIKPASAIRHSRRVPVAVVPTSCLRAGRIHGPMHHHVHGPVSSPTVRPVRWPPSITEVERVYPPADQPVVERLFLRAPSLSAVRRGTSSSRRFLVQAVSAGLVRRSVGSRALAPNLLLQ